VSEHVRCRYCGTPLTARASVEAGYGPECAAIHRQPKPARAAYLRTLTHEAAMASIFDRMSERMSGRR